MVSGGCTSLEMPDMREKPSSTIQMPIAIATRTGRRLKSFALAAGIAQTDSSDPNGNSDRITDKILAVGSLTTPSALVPKKDTLACDACLRHAKPSATVEDVLNVFDGALSR